MEFGNFSDRTSSHTSSICSEHTNLAEDARLRSAAKRQHLLDYAIGSALEFMRWFHCLPGAPKLWTRQLRQVDNGGTSLVLNIAEANGRYASGERRSLFEIAESAAVRVGTYLELCARTDKLDPEPKAAAMALLDRIASMLRGLGSG